MEIHVFLKNEILVFVAVCAQVCGMLKDGSQLRGATVRDALPHGKGWSAAVLRWIPGLQYNPPFMV